MDIFDYNGVYLQQSTDFSIILDQNQYINTINLIQITAEHSRQRHCPLSKEETILLRGAIRNLNWATGMTRPKVCEISTKIETATRHYICQ